MQAEPPTAFGQETKAGCLQDRRGDSSVPRGKMSLVMLVLENVRLVGRSQYLLPSNPQGHSVA